MNSALNPVLTSSAGPQNPQVAPLPSKAMHPQGAPAAYGQPPTSHLPQNLVNIPHPNNAAPTNHYSLNVPNSSAASYNSPIPPSNHPVANAAPAGGAAPQVYNAPKAPFAAGYQPNLGHPPNQPNALPPVSQTLPATSQSASQAPSAAPAPSEAAPPTTTTASTDKPQSNGTSESKSPTKSDQSTTPTATAAAGNHVSPAKEAATASAAAAAPPVPQTPPTPEKAAEKPSATAEQKPQPEPKQVEDAAKAPPAAEPAQPSESAQSAPEKASNEPEKPAGAAKDKPQVECSDSNSSDGKESSADDADGKASEPTAEASPAKTKESPVKTTPPPKAAVQPRTPTRKAKTTPKQQEGESPKTPKSETKSSPSKLTATAKLKRQRIRTQPYQSPLPEIEIISKISSNSQRAKTNDDKLIVFYKNEFLAVRNSEGSFFVCQAVQNIYKSSSKIKIRWLSQDTNEESGEIYTPDFYDLTDFDCILTNLNLTRVDKGKYRLPKAEKERTDSILNRSLAMEKGEEVLEESFTEEHPDGLDISLYKDENQLNKKGGKGRKRRASPDKTPKGAATRKSPDSPKVRKTVKTTKKKAVKKQPAKAIAVEPVKKTNTAVSRSARAAKRRSDSVKTSPVVDQKKARVLAKVARKTAVPASTATKATKAPLPTKSSKAPKASTSTAKTTKAAASTAAPKVTATRKTKRSARK